MAKRTYFCNTCKKDFKKIVEDVNTKVLCSNCQSSATSLKFADISVVTKEVIDNGFQPRRVEQYSNAADLFEERSRDLTKKKNNSDL